MNRYVGFRLPEDFLIGTANSAFQSEGAWDRDGKSESNMEYYAKAVAEVMNLEQMIKAETEDVIYRVQVGAFRNLDYAKSLQETLKNAGFEGFIVKGKL